MKPHLEVRFVRDCPSKIRVSASNGVFSGVGECYLDESVLTSFCEVAADFPRTISDEARLSIGEKGSNFGFIDVHFKCVDSTGLTATAVELVAEPTTHSADRAAFTLFFEPEAMRVFVRQLRSILTNGEGAAMLEAVQPYTWNINKAPKPDR